MKYFKYILLIAICLMLSAIGYINSPKTIASVDNDTGGSYSTTTPTGVSALATLKKGAGIFGSVVVTGSNSGNIQIYDATTTDVVNQNNNRQATSTLLIATLPNNTSTSTYVFDIAFRYGLLVVGSGNVATSTITWK